jgi:hypothetical protein
MRRDSDADGMAERPFDHEDTKPLFDVLFEIKKLIADILTVLQGGDDDGEEEAAEGVDE